MTKADRFGAAALAGVTGLVAFAAAWTLGSERGYERGSREMGCYAMLMAGANPERIPVPTEGDPCPYNRRTSR